MFLGYIRMPYSKTHYFLTMAHFGMQPEHRQILKKNRLYLLEGMNPEPVVQRLYQQNMMSQITVESIQELPTRYEKNAALVTYLPRSGPRAFQLFCRALSASGQKHVRNKIQPEGVTWSIGLSITLLKYDGETLHLQKGSRSVSITHSEWNNLIRYIPKILENLDPCKDSKFCLSDENLYVTTIKHRAHKHVGFHRDTSGDGSGVIMDMDEWSDFIECVAESVIEELNESHPNFHDLEIMDLIRLCYIYILQRDIIARAHNNCYGCKQEAPGQQDHTESGCLSGWEDLVHQYYPEAVAAFSGPLFTEVCR